MKDYKINFHNLVRQLLPHHMRLPLRLRILRCLLMPLVVLYEAFCAWRENTRRLMNVTNQQGVLEQFLREKYRDKTITIVSYQEDGFDVGLKPEGVSTAQAIGLDPTEGTPAAVSLKGELYQQFGDVDFIVYISAATDLVNVRADVEKYRPALTTYKIIQA